MAEDNQAVVPLAPLKFYPRSDEEFAFKPIKPRQDKRSKCLVYVLAGIVFLSVVFLVIALVMRPRTPDLGLSLVSVKNLVYTNNNASFPSFNMTIQAEFTIDNPNFGQFVFENATASVLYRGKTVGEAKIGGGRVSAKETEKIKVKVDVRSYRLSDVDNYSKDGILKLSSYANFSGRVQLWKIVKKRKTASINCSMSFNLTSPAFDLQDLICS
ncbi:hypothetical protein P3X46_016780 [Hevea brasiliensis]|uniref:Late embryogenesis abundant protein LEA-2 subgroup domain-containing protein n=1 Tax=Hevea brasiliensis TaxID=3981 RepID=A0ABQ9M2D9_HEVBR|nr:late embryogenesis abundant protein At1g64065 [Hevea brasiliensis]KAJ9173667.1 hypothetical protein P3X46_016780 [Hevea brasiliensis]